MYSLVSYNLPKNTGQNFARAVYIIAYCHKHFFINA